jgi:hypothetical protein
VHDTDYHFAMHIRKEQAYLSHDARRTCEAREMLAYHSIVLHQKIEAKKEYYDVRWGEDLQPETSCFINIARALLPTETTLPSSSP